MIVKFIINKEEHSLDITIDTKISEIKNIIIDKFYEKDDDLWLMFTYLSSKYLREFGKIALAPNQSIPLCLDNSSLRNFSEEDKHYIFKVTKSKKVNNNIKTKLNTKGKYIPTFKRTEPKKINTEFIINDYNEEFPKLS